jgi:hypothetical protein
MTPPVHNGIVWDIELSHADVLHLVAARAISVVASPIPIPAAIEPVIDYSIANIVVMDTVGGFNGVDITVVAGVAGCIVSPHGLGIYQALSQAANVAINAVNTIGDFIVKSVQSGIQSVSGTVAISVGAVAGIPGVVIGGLLHGLFGGGNQPAQHIAGGMFANSPVGQGPTGENKFVLCQIDSAQHVAVLSWQGFFSPDRWHNNTANGIHANALSVGQNELLFLIDNGDGTVSLRSDAVGTSFYLRAQNGGNNVCQFDAVNPGVGGGGWPIKNSPECSFIIEPLADGNIALQTYSRQYYVKVSA